MTFYTYSIASSTHQKSPPRKSPWHRKGLPQFETAALELSKVLRASEWLSKRILILIWLVFIAAVTWAYKLFRLCILEHEWEISCPVFLLFCHNHIVLMCKWNKLTREHVLGLFAFKKMFSFSSYFCKLICCRSLFHSETYLLWKSSINWDGTIRTFKWHFK